MRTRAEFKAGRWVRRRRLKAVERKTGVVEVDETAARELAALKLVLSSLARGSRTRLTLSEREQAVVTAMLAAPDCAALAKQGAILPAESMSVALRLLW